MLRGRDSLRRRAHCNGGGNPHEGASAGGRRRLGPGRGSHHSAPLRSRSGSAPMPSRWPYGPMGKSHLFAVPLPGPVGRSVPCSRRTDGGADSSFSPHRSRDRIGRETGIGKDAPQQPIEAGRVPLGDRHPEHAGEGLRSVGERQVGILRGQCPARRPTQRPGPLADCLIQREPGRTLGRRPRKQRQAVGGMLQRASILRGSRDGFPAPRRAGQPARESSNLPPLQLDLSLQLNMSSI